MCLTCEQILYFAMQIVVQKISFCLLESIYYQYTKMKASTSDFICKKYTLGLFLVS